jgi:hypothetical protein
MRAILSIVLCLLIACVLFAEESYTVILKNGKVMKGHLISENEDMILFKDEKGLQYSLKKAVLDLQKMNIANQPPAPPSPPEPEEVQTSPIIETTQTAPIETPPEKESAAIAPTDEDPHARPIHVAVSQLETTFHNVKSLLDGMMTAWEVNASTGRDPAAALQEFQITKAQTITASADSQLQKLDKLQESLSADASVLENFNSAVLELHQYYDAIRQYQGKPSLRVFRNRLATKEQSLQKKIEDLKKK